MFKCTFSHFFDALTGGEQPTPMIPATTETTSPSPTSALTNIVTFQRPSGTEQVITGTEYVVLLFRISLIDKR